MTTLAIFIMVIAGNAAMVRMHLRQLNHGVIREGRPDHAIPLQGALGSVVGACGVLLSTSYSLPPLADMLCFVGGGTMAAMGAAGICTFALNLGEHRIR